jgi:hypothetical protein
MSPETESKNEIKSNSLADSIENWASYVAHEIDDADFDPDNVLTHDEISTVSRISRVHQDILFQEDRFKTLSEVSSWIDSNEQFRNISDNGEIVIGKRGVKLVVYPEDGLKEGIYFKDEFWGNGDWQLLGNNIDLLVFCHIFSEIVDYVEKN